MVCSSCLCCALVSSVHVARGPGLAGRHRLQVESRTVHRTSLRAASDATGGAVTACESAPFPPVCRLRRHRVAAGTL